MLKNVPLVYFFWNETCNVIDTTVLLSYFSESAITTKEKGKGKEKNGTIPLFLFLPVFNGKN